MIQHFRNVVIDFLLRIIYMISLINMALESTARELHLALRLKIYLVSYFYVFVLLNMTGSLDKHGGSQTSRLRTLAVHLEPDRPR